MKMTKRECQKLYADTVRDIDAIQVVMLPPDYDGPLTKGYPQKGVIYMQMREEKKDE